MMSDTTTIPTFDVHLPEELLIKVHRVPGPVFSGHLPEASRTKFERERGAFYRLLPGLLATHFGQYVAIHDEQVVDSGLNRLEVALRVWQQVGNVPIYVALVSDKLQPIERSGIIRDLSKRRSGE